MNDLNLEDIPAHGYGGPCQGLSLPSPPAVSTAASDTCYPFSSILPGSLVSIRPLPGGTKGSGHFHYFLYSPITL